jgi:hypothetical protein
MPERNDKSAQEVQQCSARQPCRRFESVEHLAKTLNERKSSAFKGMAKLNHPLPANDCHENVRIYLRENPGTPIFGWLVEEFPTFTYFNAHSVVRLEDGSLIDVTELNRDGLTFLRHEGTDDFWRWEKHKRISHPPPLEITAAGKAEEEEYDRP